jgi:putative transposase
VKAKLRDDRQDAVGANDVWAMDFVRDRQEAADPDRGRHALSLLLRSRCMLHLLRRRCRPDIETHLEESWLSQDDQGGQWQRVHLSRVRLWAYANNVTLEPLTSCQAGHNSFIEAFNSRLRSE